MKFEKSKHSIRFTIERDFNLLAVRNMKSLINDTKNVFIDLTASKLVDSEAIIFIHRLLKKGVSVHVKNPPKIFYEVVQILGLENEWNLSEMVDRESDRIYD